jgi:transglutaminase-like putative cysteine protease
LIKPVHFNDYLESTETIDWQEQNVLALAREIGSGFDHETAITQACFEWVRDEIDHSVDYQKNPVTCKASDVLKYKTGYCFAKSHLLAALLRANRIPTGFCYQRLSIDDRGAPYSLHGLNAVYLEKIGWYRIDARGNRKDINAQFTPPIERLAYQIRLPEEADLEGIYSAPLPIVIQVLHTYKAWDEVLINLPDLPISNL